MAFEVFERGHHHNPRPCGTTVRIAKQTRILIAKENTEWLRQHGTHVVVLFDNEKRKIGLKPCKEGTDHAYKLYVGVSQSYLSVRAFLLWIKNAPDGLYETAIEEDMVVIFI